MSYPVEVVYCGNCGLPPEFCEYGVKFEECKPWLIKNVPHLYPHLVDGGKAAASPSTGPASGGAGTAAAAASGTTGDAAASGVTASLATLTVADEDEESGEEGDGAKKKKTKRGGQVKPGGGAAAASGGAAASSSGGGGGGGGGGAAKGAKAPKVWIELKERGKRKHVTTVTGLDSFGVKLKEAASALGKKFGAGASVTKSATGVQEIDVQGDVLYDLPALLTSLFSVPEDAIVCKE